MNVISSAVLKILEETQYCLENLSSFIINKELDQIYRSTIELFMFINALFCSKLLWNETSLQGSNGTGLRSV